MNNSILFLLVLLSIWGSIAILIGSYGNNKQIGFWAAFLISFFFSPVIGIICTAVSSRNIVEKRDPIGDLAKLHDLKEKGVISQDEYDKKASQLKSQL